MNKKTPMGELSIIEQTRDLIMWYVPLLNRLPRDHRFTLGERIINSLYELLEELVRARYSKQKIAQLEASNLRLELLRRQAIAVSVPQESSALSGEAGDCFQKSTEAARAGSVSATKDRTSARFHHFGSSPSSAESNGAVDGGVFIHSGFQYRVFSDAKLTKEREP